MKPFIELTLANSYNSALQKYNIIFLNSSKIISIEPRAEYTIVRMSGEVIEEVKETPQEILTRILNN